MGEIHDRLDDLDSYLVARSRLELWIADFMLKATKTPMPELPALVKEWFGNTQSSFSTTNTPTEVTRSPPTRVKTLTRNSGFARAPKASGKDVRGSTSTARKEK